MSHYFEQGFSVREPSWHGLATVLEDYPGREDAMRIAGHDFKLIECPLTVGLPIEPVADDASWSGMIGRPLGPITVDVPPTEWKALVRSDNNQLVSIMRGSYETIQNDSLWDIADAIIGEQNVQYETAGILKNGAVLWVLARINEPSRVDGDDSDIYPYALVSTAHDGTGATKAAAVSVRVVCWNTFQAASAQAKASGRQFSFRHTKNVMDRIEDAKAALGLIRHQHEEFIHLANDLAGVHVTNAGVQDFVELFIPEPRADVLTDRQKNGIDSARQEIWTLLDSSPTIPPDHRRSGFGLWSAGVEYLDHVRRANTPETLFRRTMMDTSMIKRKMMDVVRQVAA